MGIAEDLARTDPLPRILDWVGSHPAVLGVFGGAQDRVGAYSKRPYPRLRITDVPGGTDDMLTRLMAVRVQVEALGEVDGGPGKEELRRIFYTAVGALGELPAAEPTVEGPVIVRIRPAQAGGYLPEADGRPRYLGQVTVWCHPAW
ncbi:hypothetical protein GCM10022252_75880 [Streptosporangium oxazolinicum]|uniref:Tail terminator n=1 Tax=Streptosporangium oxazolinicum TaxID=909287 RepID=A0ABP8BL23_9ACTN